LRITLARRGDAQCRISMTEKRSLMSKSRAFLARVRLYEARRELSLEYIWHINGVIRCRRLLTYRRPAPVVGQGCKLVFSRYLSIGACDMEVKSGDVQLDRGQLSALPEAIIASNRFDEPVLPYLPLLRSSLQAATLCLE
jgi:hypothetical protein